MIDIEDVKLKSKRLWERYDKEVTPYDVLAVLDELIELIEERLE